MTAPTDCPHCGAPYPACWWSEMTGNMSESAPCTFDEAGMDPDRLREDRDERRRLEKETGE